MMLARLSRCAAMLTRQSASAVLALVALTAAELAMARSEEPRVFHLACTVGGDPGGAGGPLVETFCEALLAALAQELPHRFIRSPRASWPTEAEGIDVTVRLTSPYTANVDLAAQVAGDSGRVAAHRASVELSSMDAPLSAVAAKSLVRPIAMQLGV